MPQFRLQYGKEKDNEKPRDHIKNTVQHRRSRITQTQKIERIFVNLLLGNVAQLIQQMAHQRALARVHMA